MTREEQRLEKAIKVLREKYKKACDMAMVHNPLAYALYYTWREFDK